MSTDAHDDDLAQAMADIEEAMDAALVMDARENFAAFCEYVMIDDQGKPWEFADHQLEWSEVLEGPDELILLVGSRGCAKSTTMQAWVLFLLGRDPNTCVKYVCGDDETAMDRLKFIADNIEDNERYHRVFPHVKPIEGDWTKHKIFIERPAAVGLQDASVECSSVTAGGTGGRAHLIIFDDVIDSVKALVRPGLLAIVKSLVENDWMNLLHPDGRAIMIGTFWSFDPPDIYVEYRENVEWTRWEEPACYLDENGNLKGPYLWVERWGEEALRKRRAKVGEEAFQQQYLLKGAIQRSQFFDREHIDQCKTTSVTLGETPEGSEIIRMGMGVDVATSLKKKTGSYTAIVVAAELRDGRKVPLSIVRVKADPEVIAETVIELHIARAPETILVENNATQTTLISLINVIGEKYKISDLPVEGRFTGETKWHPDAGLPGLNAELAQQKWIIPVGGDHDEPHHECTVCAWINEMMFWGKNRDAKGRKPTTDIIMAWWLANGALDSGGSFGDLPVVGASMQREVSFGTQRQVAFGPQ